MKKLTNFFKHCIKKPAKGFVYYCQKIDVTIRAFLVSLFFIPGAALASGGNQSLGDVGQRSGDSAVGLTGGALMLFGFVGVVFVAIALMKGRQAKQQGESVGTYVGMGVVGACLFSISIIISIINYTAFGVDASQDVQGQIITPSN